MANTIEEQFEGKVLDVIADGHKAGLSPEYIAGYLHDAIIALTTPALWVAHRKTLARKGMH